MPLGTFFFSIPSLSFQQQEPQASPQKPAVAPQPPRGLARLEKWAMSIAPLSHFSSKFSPFSFHHSLFPPCPSPNPPTLDTQVADPEQILRKGKPQVERNGTRSRKINKRNQLQGVERCESCQEPRDFMSFWQACCSALVSLREGCPAQKGHH